MTDVNITQHEADALLAMEKVPADNEKREFPMAGNKIEVPLISTDKREHFSLDLSRGTINLNKIKYQKRARQVIPLVRLDLGGPPHRNPDDKEVPSPHIHLYKEGFGDKWAFPVSSSVFSNLSDHWQVLIDFLRYCNISKLPNIDKELFT